VEKVGGIFVSLEIAIEHGHLPDSEKRCLSGTAYGYLHFVFIETAERIVGIPDEPPSYACPKAHTDGTEVHADGGLRVALPMHPRHPLPHGVRIDVKTVSLMVQPTPDETVKGASVGFGGTCFLLCDDRTP